MHYSKCHLKVRMQTSLAERGREKERGEKVGVLCYHWHQMWCECAKVPSTPSCLEYTWTSAMPTAVMATEHPVTSVQTELTAWDSGPSNRLQYHPRCVLFAGNDRQLGTAAVSFTLAGQCSQWKSNKLQREEGGHYRDPPGYNSWWGAASQLPERIVLAVVWDQGKADAGKGGDRRMSPPLSSLQVTAWCVDNTKHATFCLWLVCLHCISCSKRVGGLVIDREV